MYKKSIFTSAVLVLITASIAFASPWASQVVSYTAGTNITAGYDTPSSALGEPTRAYTDSWGSYDVTPFSAPYQTSDVVGIGAGGELVVAFDQPVTDDANNPFGIDLLVFGNAFYYDASYPSGIAGFLAAEPATISVSQNGSIWFEITSTQADALYPTMGYTDSSSAFCNDGTAPTDFTKPVDPSFDPAGKAFGDIVSGYNGSGGGAGVDISSTGLSWIQYVKVSQSASDSYASEIDGFADVTAIPEPISVLMLMLGAPMILKRKIV